MSLHTSPDHTPTAPTPRILVIGYDPEFVDYTDPGTPAGLNKEKVLAGTLESLKRIDEHGWVGIQCMVRPDMSAVPEVQRALSKAQYTCIVIGGGIRLAHKSVPVFEAIVDAIRRVAPGTPLAFNEGPATSLEAAQRWITAQ